MARRTVHHRLHRALAGARQVAHVHHLGANYVNDAESVGQHRVHGLVIDGKPDSESPGGELTVRHAFQQRGEFAAGRGAHVSAGAVANSFMVHVYNSPEHPALVQYRSSGQVTSSPKPSMTMRPPSALTVAAAAFAAACPPLTF